MNQCLCEYQPTSKISLDFLQARVYKCHTHLCNKLDNLDKNIKGHVSGHNATTPFGEQSRGDGRQTTGGRRRDKREETEAQKEGKLLRHKLNTSVKSLHVLLLNDNKSFSHQIV